MPVSTTLSRALNFSNRNGKSRAVNGLKDTSRLRQQGGSAAFNQENKWTWLGHFPAAVMPQPLPSWKPQQNNPRVCKVSIPLSCVWEDSYSSPI